MAIENDKYIIYTADDEEANCLRCDYATSNIYCDSFCGEKLGWDGYKRTEMKQRF